MNGDAEKDNGHNPKSCNCEIDDVDENKKNNELSPKKRIRIQDNVRNLKNANLEIGNRYSFKIYDWLFIMNAGSLAGTITFLTIKEKDTDFIIFCVAMGVAFFFGILFILSAAKLEQSRFNNNIALIAKEYDEFKANHTTDTYFNKKITNPNYSAGFVSVLEGLSFIFFLIGVVIGLVNLVINREDLCDSKNNTQIFYSSCAEQVENTIAPDEKNNFTMSIENNNQSPEK